MNTTDMNTTDIADFPALDTADVTSPSSSIDKEVEAPPTPTRVNPLVTLAVVAAGLWWATSTHNLMTVAVAAALGGMIFVHELGHFVTARLTGMKATEFFVGFGPRLWSFKRGETEYGIKAIPLGGYVKILGMTNVDKGIDPNDEARTYRQQSYPRRILVASAGSIMHMVMAFLCFFSVFAIFGQRVEVVDGPMITTIEPTMNGAPSPAVAAGLKVGEIVLKVDGQDLKADNLSELLAGKAGKPVTLLVGETTNYTSRTITVRPVLDSVTHRPRLGLVTNAHIASVDVVRRSVPAAARRSVNEMAGLAPLTFKALGQFFAPKQLTKYSTAVANAGKPNATKDIDTVRFMSPVGTVSLLTQASENNFRDPIMFFGAINVFVGVFNMLPMLPLDGGHVLVATYERLRSTRRRRYMADVRKLMPAAYAVMFVMLLLGISSLYLDIRSPISIR